MASGFHGTMGGGGSGRTVTNTARMRSLGDALVVRDWGDARGRRALS